MMRFHTLQAVVVLALTGGCVVGCGIGSLESYAEPGATRTASETEVPRSYSPNDAGPPAARQFIHHLRLGRGVDDEGRVPRNFVANSFVAGEPIHLSMDVTDAPAGSIVRVAVHDAATDRALWGQEQTVVPGRSYLSFAIDAELASAAYRADVFIGGAVVVGQEFQVLGRKE